MLLRNHSHTSNPILSHSSQDQKREQGRCQVISDILLSKYVTRAAKGVLAMNS